MSWEALIRFAPATTLERLNDPAWLKDDRLLYDASGLKLLRSSVPLLIDHEKSREIGSVRKIMRLDADGPWVCAIAEVAELPAWLKRGTRASFAYVCPWKCSFGNPILRSGLVTEVSVLSPGVEPAEPLARVEYVKPIEPKPAAREEVIHGNGQVIRRYFDNAIVSVGGVPVRSDAAHPLRRAGADWIVDHPDGSATIYSGRGGYREALRDGVVR